MRKGTVSERLQPVRLGVAWRGVGDNACMHMTINTKTKLQFSLN